MFGVTKVFEVFEVFEVFADVRGYSQVCAGCKKGSRYPLRSSFDGIDRRFNVGGKITGSR